MSFLIPDPGELRAFAGRITNAAESARAAADRLALAVAATRWHGPAARAFAGQADVAVAGLRTASGRLHDAAAALRRHADHVEGLLYVALGLVRAGFGPLPELLAHPDRVLRPMGAELHDVATAAGGVISDVGDTIGGVLDSVGLG
jgi:uncharacterized protein YukE